MILNKLIQSSFQSPPLRGGWLGFLFFFLVSCNTDDHGVYVYPEEEEDIPICFEIGFASGTRVTTGSALISKWEDGDEIGLYIVKGNQPLEPGNNYIDNWKLTYDIATDSWLYTPLPAGKKYFPNDGDNLSFYAYYPYNASPGIDPTNILFSVETDQDANYNKSEWLLAKAENYRRTQTAVPLNFSHAHSLLQIEVASEGGIPQPDDNLQVSITNILPDARGNLQTSMVTEGIRKTISMQKVTGLAHTYRALMPAQTLGADTKIIFIQTTSGKQINMEYAGLQTVSLEAGRVHKYKITLSDL